MKIIVATPLYPPEIARIAVYSRQVARRLKINNQVSVLAYGHKIDPKDDLAVLVVDKTQPLFVRLLKYSWALFKLSKTHDIIYVQNAVAAGLPAVLVKYFTGKPVVVNFLEDEAWKRSLNWNLTSKSWDDFFNYKIIDKKIKRVVNIQKWTLRHASKILVNSNYLKELLVSKYKIKSDKILVLRHPEDRDFKLSLPMVRRPHQILVAGPLRPWTNMAEVIKAAASLSNKFSDIKLIISGSGPDKGKLVKLAKELGLFDRVEFLGQISQAEYWYLLKTVAVYVHNFSGIDYQDQISQCLLAQTPIIASNHEFNKEFLAAGDSNVLFEAGDIEDMAAKIEAALVGNIRHIDLSKDFFWEKHIDTLDKVLAAEIKK